MKVVLIILGFISMGIGIVGIVAPILPTTPFLLLASFFFAKGSKRFHDWFISTKIYKKYLESFVKSKAMTLKNKFTILFPVSCMLIITFIFVNNKTRNVKKSTKQNTNISFLDFSLYFSKEIIKIYVNKQENTIINISTTNLFIILANS